MFTKIELPKHLNGQLYLGDNLEIMKSLPSLSIDLVYLDPPFFSGRNYLSESKIDLGEKREFEDTFDGDLNKYLKFLYLRLAEVRRLLKPTGCIYIHLDYHAVFEVKCFVMDKIFGRNNLLNEIVWHYQTYQGQTKNCYPRKHDVILFYAKNVNSGYTFHLQKDTNFESNIDFERWNEYLVNNNEIRGGRYPSSDSRFMMYYNRWVKENGRVPTNDDVIVKLEGQTVDTVWEIKAVDPKSKDRLDYPTQKPPELLERIIKGTSNEGDTVVDFFGGSGTTAAVCQRLNRKWITCDKSEKSIDVIKTRLLGNKSVKDNSYQIDVENAWS